MAEILGNSANYEPFGVPPHFEQYDPYSDGTIQIAERYDESTNPGLAIDWEAHPSTGTADPEVASQRCAIIQDEANNAYFLQGDRLYDLKKSQDSGAREYVQLDEHDAIPDLVIGQPAGRFSNGSPIKSVLIASARVRPDDPAAANIRGSATARGRNPFVRISLALERLGDTPEVQADPGPGVETNNAGLYDFASARVHDFGAGSMAGKKISVATGMKIENGLLRDPVARNKRTGRRMSPTALSQEVDPGEQERLLDEWADNIRDVGGAALDSMKLWPGLRRLTARREDRRREAARVWRVNQQRAANGQRPVPKRRLL